MKKLLQPIRDFFKFLLNIWKFRKALWVHTNWDYSGVLYFLKISISDIAKYIEEDGIEVDHSRLKKVEKMKRVVQILDNISEYKYFDIVELELGRRFISWFSTKEIDDENFELSSDDSDEQKEFNLKFFNRVTELEEQEWNELWEILKGQNCSKFSKELEFDDQFDGSGLRGWWD